MLSYFQAVCRCRYFWLSLVKMDLRTRYRRSVLGMGWSLLHPIAMTIVLCFVFSHIFKANIRNYAPYLLAGLSCWHFIVAVTIQGCQSLFQSEAYIRQYPAPIVIYPLRTALAATVHFLLALVIVVLLSWVLHGFGNALALLTLLPTVVLLFALGWTLAILASFANVYFQDTQHLCDVGLQILFYATPIIYEPRILQGTPFAWILRCNPLLPFLQLIREPILTGQAPGLATYGIAFGIVAGLAGLALLTVSRLQRQFIFQL
jgi:ABC-type polysaccharide/polyol phosphate export permease